MLNRWIFSVSSYVFTICFYDDDVLSLIKMAVGTARLKEADHLIDTVQRSVEVGARLMTMACTRTHAKR